jgi:ribosomal subunit interface protein
MNTPLEITFHNMEPSDAVEARVREKVSRLERVFDRMTHCRVTIEAPHRNHHKGKIYHVRIDVGIPGHGNVLVNREAEENHAHEDVFVALRDAFDAARRQVQEAVDKMGGKTKTLRGPKHREPGQGG